MELWGHEVKRAYNGVTAIELSAEFRPQAIFLDIGLPGMDGYEVAARLRASPETSGSMLVAVTGYGQEEDRRRSQRAGFDQHLVKPVSPDHLQSLLASLQSRAEAGIKPEVT
jgi:CheY-like chemotaxis protein